jgi:hypothetical protein
MPYRIVKSFVVDEDELETFAAKVRTSVQSSEVQLLSTSQKSDEPVSRMTFCRDIVIS